MDRPTCKTCPFWVVRVDDADNAVDPRSLSADDLDITEGECRRNAPRHTIYSHEIQGIPTRMEETHWPPLYGSDWCGDHPDSPGYVKHLMPHLMTFEERKARVRKLEVDADVRRFAMSPTGSSQTPHTPPESPKP